MITALRAARRRSGQSLQAVAERLGVTHTAVSNWERGVSTPSIDRIRACLDVLGVPPEEQGPIWAQFGVPHEALAVAADDAEAA